jgi:hypothetical protein
MRYRILWLLLLLFSPYSLKGETVVSVEIAEDSYIDSICAKALPKDSIEQKKALTLSYIQGALHAKFPKTKANVALKNNIVLLSCLPKEEKDSQEIIAYVQEITAAPTKQNLPVVSLDEEETGIWFPQSSVLFPTQVANPRQATFAGGVRAGDKIQGALKAPISLGAQFPMYRWLNVLKGDLQLEIECCAFSLFNLFSQSNSLINADYYVGIPLTYAKDNWRGRARIYHISSHIGDEYLLRHSNFHRKNKSFEAVDFSCAYYVLPELYFFGTLGSIIASDKEMPLKKLYFEYGFEVRGKQMLYEQLFRRPFLSVFLRNAQDVSFKQDLGLALGYEWGKIQNIGRLFRAYLEYHQGFLPDGQFSWKKDQYVAFKISYGF